MSEDERHAINGKMVADYVQTKRDLATLNRKANDLSGVLKQIAGNLELSADAHRARTLSGSFGMRYLQNIRDRKGFLSSFGD